MFQVSWMRDHVATARATPARTPPITLQKLYRRVLLSSSLVLFSTSRAVWAAALASLAACSAASRLLRVASGMELRMYVCGAAFARYSCGWRFFFFSGNGLYCPRRARAVDATLGESGN